MSQEKKGSIKKLIFVDFILELKYIEKMVDLFIIVDAQGIFFRTILTSFLRLYVEFREIVQGFGRK